MRNGDITNNKYAHYETPEPLIRAILTRFKRYRQIDPERILEPGCGDNAPWLKVARELWPDVYTVGVDARSVDPGDHVNQCYHMVLAPGPSVFAPFDLVLANPPYARGQMEPFFEVCWRMCSRTLVWLAPLSWMCRETSMIYTPDQIYALRHRPKFNGAKGTDSREYGIFVYRKHHALYDIKTTVTTWDWRSEI